MRREAGKERGMRREEGKERGLRREAGTMGNKLKEMIAAGENGLGTFFSAGDMSMMECLGYTGLDFVIIDCEHGPFDTMDQMDMIRAAESVGLTPIVRIADVSHKEIQRALDAGAQGLVVPCLRTMDEIKKMVDLAKYPPLGNRGFIKGRGAGFGNMDWASGSVAEFMANSNDRVLLLPQCETAECLDIIEDVAKVDGVDGIFIGPFDLSISLGIPGDFDNPVFTAALDRIVNAFKAEGKLVFAYVNTPEEAIDRFAKGYDGVTVNLNFNIMVSAYKSLVRSIRK